MPDSDTATTSTTATATTSSTLEWSDLDKKAVDTVRVLAMDAVQKVGNGHPGTAMSLAPAAYLLYQHHLRHDPSDERWLGRDRFVLSCGHSSLTQYIQLYFSGYGLELEDLEALRTWASRTPGHPEYGHTTGIEVTTGPLGQGVGNAVGMAMDARRVHGLLDPEAEIGDSLFDYHVYALASDGDMEEGVSGEASSLAATQRLGNLTLIYDHNEISIEDDTDIAFTEDVAARYEAYGWHVQRVSWRTQDGYHEDVPALHEALLAAEAVHDRPSFISLQTIIGWPAPTLQNTGKAHGAALGADEVRRTKEILGFDPEKDFEVPPEVIDHVRSTRAARGRELRSVWDERYAAWRSAQPERAANLDRMRARELPASIGDALPVFPAGKDVATRKASGEVLGALAPILPELWGGSADLAESNNTTMEGEPSFLPPDRSTKMFPGDWYGRTLHFGVREHAMSSVMNGIVLGGITRPYGGTFLIFSDYERPAIRLAALMKIPTTFVWTHDSIGLGEDGPTHQPVEQLAALRAIPGLDVVRPADANETAIAWRTILSHHDRPAGIALTRQNLPVYDRSEQGGFASAEGVSRGAYVLRDADGEPDVVLIGTGSEVQLAVEARDILAGEGIAARVVSMPCREWFTGETREYQDEVIPPQVRARVSVEAAVSMGWRDVVGDTGRSVSLEHFGASADYKTIYREFGITADAVAQAARDSLEATRAGDLLPPTGKPQRGGTGDRGDSA